MARNKFVVVVVAVIGFLFCVFSSFLTTEFLDVQQMVRQGSVRFQDKASTDNGDNGNGDLISGDGYGYYSTSDLTTTSTRIANPSNNGSAHVTLTAPTATVPPLSRQNNRTTGTTTVPTVPAPIPATVSSKNSPMRNVHHNVSTRLQNATSTTKATTATATATTNVITWEGVDDMNSFITRYWKGNKFCETMEEVRNNETTLEQRQRPTTFLNITFGCQDLFTKSGLGTGNFISAFYGLRLAATVLENVHVQVTCPDAVQKQTSLILPWLMGSFPASHSASHTVETVSDQRELDVVVTNSDDTSSSTVPMPTIQQACGNYDKCPIGFMVPSIRYELRRMAVALVGVPHENHPAAAFAERYLWNTENDNDGNNAASTMQLSIPAKGEPPLIPGVVLDDVVLHFRGGDLFNSNHPGFGFMKFSAFSKRISPGTKSIGIVTQPFDNGGQHRSGDASSEKRQRHRIVVMALVDFLKEKFPQARVTIHNGRDETIALAYARMVMANQTMVGITSFGVFPAIACFGTGYIRKPDFKKGPNQFLINPPIDQLADNIILMKEPNRLMAGTVRAMFKRPTGQELVLEWFKNDTYCNGLPCF